MNIKKKILLTILSLIFFYGLSYSIPAYPEPFEAQQPDGSKIILQMQGDEFYGWTEDENGYTVVRDEETKEWYYAKQDEKGDIVKTKHKVGKVFPGSAGLQKHIKKRDFSEVAGRNRNLMQPKEDSERILQKITKDFNAQSQKSAVQDLEKSANQDGGPVQPAPVTYKHLVILVEFSDKKFVLSDLNQKFDDLFNKENYNYENAKGSVRDYYNATTYGKLKVESVIAGPVTVSSTSSYYAGSRGLSNGGAMTKEALAILNNQKFNFAQFDDDGDGLINFITVVHAGGGQEAGVQNAIWSHKGNISTFPTWDGKYLYTYNTIPELRGSNESAMLITRIGVACHELGHAMLGLPDLYDITYESKGIGYFCLMAYGGNCDGGRTPTHLSAWCKSKAGFSTVTTITADGFYTLADAAVNDTAFYKFSGNSFSSTEYFLIENRPGTGFDASLPGLNTQGRGILIWHIDENIGGNSNYLRYKVDLEEADGSNALALNSSYGATSHYFRAGNVTEFNDTTNPNSKSYSGASAGKPISQISAPGAVMSFIVGTIAGGPTISSVTPSVSKLGKTVTVTVLGTNFVNGSAVKLTKGNANINGSPVTFVSSNQIKSVFTIPDNVATGYWDLVISSSAYAGGSMTKTNAFNILENISVLNINKSAAIKGSSSTFDIGGKNFESGMTVKLVSSSTTISASSINILSSTFSKCTFNFLNTIADETSFNLTVTASDGDSSTLANAVKVYSAPAVQSFTPDKSLFGTNIVLSVKGTSFISGYTSFKLKKKNSVEVIVPTVQSMTKTAASLVFPSAKSDVGNWQVCAVSSLNGKEYAGSAFFSIYSDDFEYVDIDEDKEIRIKIISADGQENYATAFIRAYTFSGPVNIAMSQERGFLLPKEESGLKHSNIGLMIDSEGSQPLKTILLKIPYTPSDIDGMNESSLALARFDESTQSWVKINSWIDRDNKLVCANISAMSTFAILGGINGSDITDGRKVKYYPNPLKFSKTGGYEKMNFEGVLGGSEIKIYNFLGVHIRTVKSELDGTAVWDGRNEQQEIVASGVYIVQVEGNEGKKKIKVAVER